MSPADPFLLAARGLAAFVTPGYLAPASATHDVSRLSARERAMTTASNGPAVEPGGSDPQSDLALVTAMAGGDESAATRLYDRYSAVLYGLALRITGVAVDAEDVVVDCFAQAWREAARFDVGKGSVIAWLTMMTRSRALDCVRARQRREKVTDRAAQEPEQPVAMSQGTAAADAVLEQGERALAVTSALQQLPPPQRRAIELAFFEGLTHPEVAERLREPLGTVKTRIRLGMQKLREALGGWSSAAGEGVS